MDYYFTRPAQSDSKECPEMHLSISADGYIRLAAESIRSIAYDHLLSGLDEEVANSKLEGAVSAEISGYTEWVSLTTPAITLGWDWFLDCRGGAQNILRAGKPSSNVMAVDQNDQDFGYDVTLDLLCSLVDTMDWRPVVIEFIRQRYSATVNIDSC